MKRQYYPVTYRLYFELKSAPCIEVNEIADGSNVDSVAMARWSGRVSTVRPKRSILRHLKQKVHRLAG